MESNDIKREDLFRALAKMGLNKSQQEILSERYGLKDNQPKSLDEVAQLRGITRDEVQQIERKMMEVLRNSGNISQLKSLIITVKQSPNKDILVTPRKSKRNIYKYFSDFSEEEIDSAIELLTDEEKEMLTKRYGSNLKDPELNEMSNKELQVINKRIFQKIENLLNNKPINISPKIDEIEAIEEANKKKLLKKIRETNFEKVLLGMSRKEAIISSLIFGYIDDKTFEIDEVADFFNMSRLDVIDVVEKSLKRYKGTVSGSINEMENIFEKEKIKIKSMINKKGE